MNSNRFYSGFIYITWENSLSPARVNVELLRIGTNQYMSNLNENFIIN